jgi:DNA transformation protein and related proteins
MTTDSSYRDFVQEQLESVLPAIHAKAMFGGVGIYSHGVFFALIAGDTLYFYADETSRADYNASDGQRFGKNYFEVPIGVLEDVELLREWAQKALVAAQKKRQPHPPRK